ncbi:hypothetical protein L6452_19493 [Arctium lappa]|uniref:Uncharacterized protein n=1 Tax=Arctium lappa TaxID=4217 RepID=A0ACB9B9L0_ARCLA|nr:hypothetical protein L6452_19493 [Arctium lappa]
MPQTPHIPYNYPVLPHSSKPLKSKPQGKVKSKAPTKEPKKKFIYIKCYNCGDTFHLAKDCPKERIDRYGQNDPASSSSSNPKGPTSKRGPTVTFGDNSRGSTKGYGTLSNGSITFNKVAYVEGIMHNLLSISQLCDLGFYVIFRMEDCLITDKNFHTVLSGFRKDNVGNKSNQDEGSICFIYEDSEKKN